MIMCTVFQLYDVHRFDSTVVIYAFATNYFNFEA